MGLWSTFKNALGLAPALTIEEPGPFAISEAAQAAIDALPEGQVLHVKTVPVDAGRLVRVEAGDDAPGLETLGPRVRASAADVDHLVGLELDVVDGRYKVSTHLELRGRETPNPDGRLYLASRPLNHGGARFYQDVDDAPPIAKGLLASPAIKSVLFRAHTVSVVREEGAPWDAIDRHVAASLQHYLLHCGKALVPSPRSDEENSELEQKVLDILEERVRPRIHADGGDIDLVEVKDGIVRVHMIGACSGCPASTMTLKFGIEQTLQQLLPGEIERVEQV